MGKVPFYLALMILLISCEKENTVSSTPDTNDSQEMASMVSQLQKEIEELKMEVSQLKDAIGKPSAKGNFEVDGILYSADGLPLTQPLSSSSYTAENVTNDRTYQYDYDEYGRMTKSICEYTHQVSSVFQGSNQWSTTTTEYSYSGKSITTKRTVISTNDRLSYKTEETTTVTTY